MHSQEQTALSLPRNDARIAVIGAGAAGLTTARALIDQGFQVVVFEAQDRVGGTWIMSENDTENCQPQTNGIRNGSTPRPTWISSMYDSLRTNLPKEVMNFIGHPFPSELPSFLTKDQVLIYLQEYADRNDLVRFVRFQTWVKLLEPLEADEMDRMQYKVTIVHKDGHETTETFDAVAICNGHYTDPAVPSIPGAETFPSKVMHSHYYRTPEPFKNMNTVALLGAGPSGVDIAIELSGHIKHVILCHNHTSGRVFNPGEIPNLTEAPLIRTLNPDSTITFVDGTVSEKIDAVILCTGYLYAFPFLSPSCGVQVQGAQVSPLWRDIINAAPGRSNMALIGLPWKVVPFPVMDYQARFVAALWAGKIKGPVPSTLPSLAKQEAQERIRMPDYKPRHYHRMGTRQFEYMQSLADAIGIPGPSKTMQEIANDAASCRSECLSKYRERNYSVEDSGGWRVL